MRPDPGQHEPLVHQAEPAVQVDRVPGAQALVLDLGHDRGRLVQRRELTFRRVQVVPAEHALDRKLEQRDPAGDQVAHGPVAVGQPQVARVEAVRLDGHVGLSGELLLHAERALRGPLAGRVAVEGKDHLARERVRVHDEAAQHLDVVLAERGAAGGHRGRYAGQVAGHHVGVPLDDDRLPALRDLALGQVRPV